MLTPGHKPLGKRKSSHKRYGAQKGAKHLRPKWQGLCYVGVVGETVSLPRACDPSPYAPDGHMPRVRLSFVRAPKTIGPSHPKDRL